jgi:hypothetical protein
MPAATLAGRHARDAAQEHAAPSVEFLQEPGALLRGHAAGYLAHGNEQGQTAVRNLDGFIGDRRGPGFLEIHGQLSVRGKVKIREDDLFAPEHGDFRRLGFLHLDDHVGFPKNVSGIVDKQAAGGPVLLVHETAVLAGPSLNENAVPALREIRCAVRRHGNAVLRDLDLGRDAYLHGKLLVSAIGIFK